VLKSYQTELFKRKNYIYLVKRSFLENWKSKGSYINFGVFKHQVYVQLIGKREASAEKTLLLIHGFPESSYSYHKVINGLSQLFDRIILFDFIGFGLSDKPTTNFSYSILEHADVALVVWEHFGIKGGHLLAHDMGDSVATEIVARHCERTLPNWFNEGLQSATFTNGSMVLSLADLRITQKMLLTKAGRLLNMAIGRSLFQHQIKSAHGNDELSKEDIEDLWAINVYQNGIQKAYLTIKYYFDRQQYEKTRWLPALIETSLPIHLCWGDADAVAKVDIAYHLKEQICSNPCLTIMPNVGHFCQLSNPEVWSESVSKFYNDLADKD